MIETTTIEAIRVTRTVKVGRYDMLADLAERLERKGWRVALLSGGCVLVWNPEGGALIEHRAKDWTTALARLVRWLA